MSFGASIFLWAWVVGASALEQAKGPKKIRVNSSPLAKAGSTILGDFLDFLRALSLSFCAAVRIAVDIASFDPVWWVYHVGREVWECNATGRFQRVRTHRLTLTTGLVLVFPLRLGSLGFGLGKCTQRIGPWDITWYISGTTTRATAPN